MTIREAVESDVPRLVEMGCRFIAAYQDDIATNPTQLEHFARLLITSGVIFVSERDGVLTGMLGAMRYAHPMSGQPTVAEMFWWVEPEARGDGVRLLKRLEQWADTHGAERVIMTAPTPQVGRVYDRLGYHATETSYVRTLCRQE